MSFQADDGYHKFQQRVLLSQLNYSTDFLESVNPDPGNGSETSPPTQPVAANTIYNDDSRAKEYSPLPRGTGSNFLNTSHGGANNDVIIPIPDWSTALREWGMWWDLHVFGISVLFLILAFISIATFIRFRDRVLRFQIVLNTLVLLATSGLFRAIFLLVDAYGHQFRMSGYLVGIMTQAVYPLLCACFGLTQVMLVKVTNVDVGPKKFRSLSSLLGCTLGYLFLIVVIESIVYLEPHLKLFLLLDSGCFIAWSLYLAITFICSGFRLSQYTSETKRARKELNAFSIQRRSASNANTLSTISNSSNDACFNAVPVESPDVIQVPHATATDFSEETTSASFPSSSSCSFSNYAAPQGKTGTIRLSRPRMKIADHNHMTIAMVTDDDDESTSSTDVDQSSCDVSHKTIKTFTRQKKKRSSKSRSRAQYKTKHDAAVERLLSMPNDTDDRPLKHIGSPHRGRTTNKDGKGEAHCQNTVKNSDNWNRNLEHKEISVDMNFISIDTSSEDTHCLKPLGFQNNDDITAQGSDLSFGCDRHKPDYSNSIEQDGAITPDNTACSSVKENGYLADTENVLNSKSSKTNKSRLRAGGHYSQYESQDESGDSKDKDSDCEDWDCTPPLAVSDRLQSDAPAIMSLFRIRQSKMVHRAVHLTYFLTFLFVFACLMQLYTVFGVYGVLGKTQRPHPWPWLIFHTIFRLLECSIGFTCAAIAFITLNYRHQRAKRRLLQQQQQQQQDQAGPLHTQQALQHHSSEQDLERLSSLTDTRECVV